MSMKIACPSCGFEYQIREGSVGKKFRCKKCDGVVIVLERSSHKSRSSRNSNEDDEIEDYEPTATRRGDRYASNRDLPIGKIAAVVFAVIAVVGGLIGTAAVSRRVITEVKRAYDNWAANRLPSMQPFAKLSEVSPAESGFAMTLPAMPIADTNAASDESRFWRLQTSDGFSFWVHRFSIGSKDRANRALPTEKEVMRNSDSKLGFVLDNERQTFHRPSKLSGVVAAERGYEATHRSGRERRTRIGQHFWTVQIDRKTGITDLSDAEYEEFFNSFRVIDFARPAVLDAFSRSGNAQSLARYEDDEAAFWELRRKYPTRLTKAGPAPQAFKPSTPPADVRQITYSSDNLQLAAWYAVPEGKETSKSPAVVYFHGGFAFDANDFAVCRPFLQAGFVVMTPMLRGENGNPGHFEFFRSELHDGIAAVSWIAQQPEVDATKIFTFGHSIGGGMSALMSLAPAEVPVVLSGSACGLYDKAKFASHPEYCPFDVTDDVECRSRLLIGNQKDMQRRHVAYLGSEDVGITQNAKLALAEANRGRLLELVTLQGDHESSLAPAIQAFITKVQNELRNSAVPGSSTSSLPDAFSSSSSNATGSGKRPVLSVKDDPYFNAPYRMATSQPIFVGDVRGFAVAEGTKNWIALGGEKGTVQVLNTKDGDVYRSVKVDGGPEAVAFSGNGKFLAINTGANKLRLFDLQARSFLLNEPTPGGGIIAMVPSDYENNLVIATKQNTLLALNAPQRKTDSVLITTIARCEDQITGLRLVGADSKQVAVIGVDGTLRLLDVRARKFSQEFPLKSGALTSVTTTADGKFAIIGSLSGTLLVRLSNGEIAKTLYAHPEATALATAPSTEKTPALAAIGHADGRVLLIKTETGEAESVGMLGSTNAVRYLSFANEGTTLIGITDKDAKLFVWDLTKPAEARKTSSSRTFGF